MNSAVRGEHSLLEEIKERSFRDTVHCRVCRFHCRGTRIIAKPFDVGMAEHDVTSHFMSDKGMSGPISAEHAVRIRIEVCHIKDRQVFTNESRAIACAPLGKSPLPIRSVCCRGWQFAGRLYVLTWRLVLAHCGFPFLHFAAILWIDRQFRLNSRATGQVPGPSRPCTADRDDQSQRSWARGG